MANLSITAANVKPGAGARINRKYNAGATVTQGQPVYLDAANKWQLADCNSATAAARVADGIALNGASADQPLAVQTGGDITLGAALTNGTDYFLSGTAGAICPRADLTTGDYPCRLGMAVSATVLRLNPSATPTAL